MPSRTTDPALLVRLDVWADIACPWCYLGSRRLDRVIEDEAAAGRELEVRHRPFELNPDLPPEGVPMAGFLEARFGSADAVVVAQERLAGLGRDVGIAYDFAAVGKAPNTRLAHALLQTYDGDPRQRLVVRALYAAYFEDGRDITDIDTLVDVAAAVTDEPAEEVHARTLASADVDTALAHGRALGISAVPTFVADAGVPVGGLALSAAAVALQGAQSSQALAQLLAESRTRAAG
jgi:predicted DsbA family dithiol-disulfide isomerase